MSQYRVETNSLTCDTTEGIASKSSVAVLPQVVNYTTLTDIDENQLMCAGFRLLYMSQLATV